MKERFCNFNPISFFARNKPKTDGFGPYVRPSVSYLRAGPRLNSVCTHKFLAKPPTNLWVSSDLWVFSQVSPSWILRNHPQISSETTHKFVGVFRLVGGFAIDAWTSS